MKKILIIITCLAIISTLAIRFFNPRINLGNKEYLEDPIQEYFDLLQGKEYDEIYNQSLDFNNPYNKEEYIEFLKELYYNIDYTSLSYKLIDEEEGTYDILCHNAYLSSIKMVNENVITIVD